MRELTPEEITQVSGGLAVAAGANVLGAPVLSTTVATSPVLSPVLSFTGTAVGGVLGKL